MTLTTTFDRLGDFVVALPMVSWVYKTTGEKTHFVFTKEFTPHKKIEALLRFQPFTKDVSYVDLPFRHQTHDWKNDDPSKFGISDGRNINLGFITWPPVDKFIGLFYAEQYDLGFDHEFVLLVPEFDDCPSYDNVWIETEPYRDTYKLIQNIVPKGAVELLLTDPMEKNLRLALNAKHVWTTGGGFAVMLALTGKEGIIIHKTLKEFIEGDRRGFLDYTRNRYDWVDFRYAGGRP